MRFVKPTRYVALFLVGPAACGDAGTTGPTRPPPPPIPAFQVDASASVDRGDSPLSDVEITATVTTDTSGVITYTFDCDVADGRTDATEQSRATALGSACSYPTAGTFTFETCASLLGRSDCGRGTLTVTTDCLPGGRCEGDREDGAAQRYQPMMRLYYVCPKDPGRCRDFDTDGTIEAWVDAGQTWFQNHAGTQVRIDEADGRYEITFVQLDVFDADIVDETAPVFTFNNLIARLEAKGFRYPDKSGYIFYEGGGTTLCGYGEDYETNGWAASFLRDHRGPIACDSEIAATSTAEPLVFPSFLFIHETGHAAGLAHNQSNHRDFMYSCDIGGGCDGPPDRETPLFDPDNIYRNAFLAWRYLTSN